MEFEQDGNEKAEYGISLLYKLLKDLTALYGKGFGRSNLFYMRKLHLQFPKILAVSGQFENSGTLFHKGAENFKMLFDMSTRKIKKNLLAELPTANTLLNEKYGVTGTPTREEFAVRSRAWYYAELLKEKRKEQKLTQAQLAERIGKKREYIALLER